MYTLSGSFGNNLQTVPFVLERPLGAHAFQVAVVRCYQLSRMASLSMGESSPVKERANLYEQAS